MRRAGLSELHTVSYFIYLIGISLVCLVISGITGTDSLYYGGIPVFLAAFYLILVTVGTEKRLAGFLKSRLRRGRITDAILFFECALGVSLGGGLMLALIFLSASSSLSSLLFKEPLSSLSLCTAAPLFICASAYGTLKGFLESTGLKKLSVLSMYVLTLLSVFLGIAFGISWNAKGEKVALLLQNSHYGCVYAAAGTVFGLSMAMLAVFIILLVCSMISLRALRGREDTLRIDHDEQMSGIIPFYFRSTVSAGVCAFLPSISLIVSQRTAAAPSETDIGVRMAGWGSWIGVSFPLILATACACFCVFAHIPDGMTADFEKRRYATLRKRYVITFRLLGYIAIPASCFLFASARPIIQIFHGGLSEAARDSAVQTLRLGFFCACLLSVILLLVVYCMKAGHAFVAAAGCLSGTVLQTVLLLVLTRILPDGIIAVPLSLTAGLITAWFTISTLAGRDLLRFSDSTWLTDWMLIFASALLAGVPVLLLNNLVVDEIIAFGGMILLLIPYTFLFVVLSLYLRAADLVNIRRIPGGRYIYRLARILRMV